MYVNDARVDVTILDSAGLDTHTHTSVYTLIHTHTFAHTDQFTNRAKDMLFTRECAQQIQHSIDRTFPPRAMESRWLTKHRYRHS